MRLARWDLRCMDVGMASFQLPCVALNALAVLKSDVLL